MAVLALALGVNPSDVVPINSRSFQIPILIKDGQRDKIKEMVLFSSSDQGVTWNQAAVATPDKDSFTFFAPNDGLYWFNITVVDSKGNREPDIYKTPPRQKVLVDTVKPTVRFASADRQGDDVVVAWDIQEPNPDLDTLKLEYRSADAPQWSWSAVNVSRTLTGQARFRPSSLAAVTVRLQMSDSAGNLGTAQSEVVARTAQAPLASPATGAAPTTAIVQNTATPTPLATQSYSSPPANGQLVQTPPAPGPNWGPSTATVPIANASVGGLAERMPAVQAASLSQPDPRALPDRNLATQLNNGYSSDPSGRLASAVGYGNSMSAGVNSRWPGAAIVPLQLTNSPQVSLDYQVTKTGPSGIGSVELYLTEDEGRTWRHYADDPDLTSPITVTLPGEGVFGLRLVVASKAGLGRRPPQSGDLPQMRVEVDTTPPSVKLNYPQADSGRRDALVLTWTASDRNLAAGPITLQWSERADGPWHDIAVEMTNSGRYTWQLGPNLPVRVYLRITARDSAGNTAFDETPEAVLIDLHEPEAQILGIVGSTLSRDQRLSR
jgi:hypothetical protein